MKRSFRLTRSADFKRVRNDGKSYAHPLLVLLVAASEQEHARVGISAGKSLGGAVQRNRAKRLIREAIRPFLASIPASLDLVFIARKPVLTSDFKTIQKSLRGLLRRAGFSSDAE